MLDVNKWHKWVRVFSWFFLFNAVLLATTAFAQIPVSKSKTEQLAYTRTSGAIGAGQPWETKWYAIDSGVHGPTVLVTGGIHGNEPAGFRAAQQIQHWPIESGKLIVIPKVNTLGLMANTRYIPEHRNDKKLRDLNRNFPTRKRPGPQTELAGAVWEYVKKIEPDFVFDLHEGFAIHRVNSKSVGSSVISFPAKANVKLASKMLAAVNQTIENEKHHFSLLAKSGPATGSLARASSEQLGAKAYIIETTSRDQPISKRTRQHRTIIAEAFKQIGLLSADSKARDVVAPDKISYTTVALFDGPGTSTSRNKIAQIIDQQTDGFIAYLGVADIRPEILKQFDVVVFPGGSGSKQGKAIGEKRRQHVRDFIGEGGGCVGICAGAYLCSSHYEWSLHVINTKVYNKMVDIKGVGRKSMWYRGKATDVKVEFNEFGSLLLNAIGEHVVRYQNGPIVSPGTNDSLPPYRVLASFRSENYQYAVQKGTMTDTPAVVYAKYGEGVVFSVSPHFESTPKLNSVVNLLVRQAESFRTN